MSDLQNQINHRIETFIADITALARQQALETLQSALGGVRGRARTSLRIGAAAAISRKKGEKRSAGEITRTVGMLSGHIAQQPGSRIEQIARQLGVSTKDLTLPIRKLIASGEVRTEGQRRATKYFPGDGGAAPRRRGKKSRK